MEVRVVKSSALLRYWNLYRECARCGKGFATKSRFQDLCHSCTKGEPDETRKSERV